MHSRVYDILHILLTESVVTGEYLANTIKVSSRTIRNDMKELDSLLSRYGASIKSLMGAGYQLEVIDDQLFRKLLKEVIRSDNGKPGDIPEFEEDRSRFLLKCLLLAEGYVKLDDLADKMYVSRSTIQNDIKNVKQILKRYDLCLDKRPNYGIKIKGIENKLRYCLSEFIFNRNDESRNACGFPLPLLSQNEMAVIRDCILEQVEENGISLSDIALNNLGIHIAIACKRILEQKYASFYPEEIIRIETQKEYGVAQKLAAMIGKELHLTFPSAEIAYIAIHLLGVKTITDAHINLTEIKSFITGEIYQLTEEILEMIEKDLQLGIRYDTELFISLSLHLKPVINRFNYGMKVRNPMLDDFKHNYPVAFEAGILAAEVIRRELGIVIDDNEIGYLAIHIGGAMERKKMENRPKRCMIVCASGAGSARLLYYKLQSVFGTKLDIVGTTEYYKLDRLPLHSLDFVISTIPLPDTLPIPHVEVKTFLGGEDIERIGQVVSGSGFPALEYMRKKLLFLQQKFDSKEEVLHFLGSKLLGLGLVDESFTDSVFKRESVSPTSFGNFVAIPHPLKPQTQSTFWVICTLQKSINWDDKPVQLICLLCVQRNSTEDLQKMYDILASILNNEELVQQLLRCKTYQDFIHVFCTLT
ncbi:BglG family transcription antiterminator [Paenibacillus sp. BR2-3]|uniref:BglG family transcription antiterminator n=1 Tax=Paenibacillus sp. BR2-3 TaxID=3048494 RepID=UPI0039773182